MRNIVEEKPTYAELESKLKSKVAEHEKDVKATLLIMMVLVVALVICGVGWITNSSDVNYQKGAKDDYFNKWRSCLMKPEIARTVDYTDAIKLKAREAELSKAEFEFRVKKIQWEAAMEVEEAKLGLQLQQEREQLKLNNQVKAAK